MNSLNEVNLIGNLTKDPEVRVFQNGNSMVSFSLATNRTYKTDDGEKKDVPEYHNIVCFGKLVEIVDKYLRKGNKAWIRGRLQTRSYEAKDGSTRYSTEVVMTDLIMLSPKAGGQSERASAPATEVDEDQAIEQAQIDDLPF